MRFAPVPPDAPEEMARVARGTRIPIAAGERLTTKYDFARLLQAGAAAILQMNLGRVGGILEAKKIAGMSRPIAMMTKEAVNAAYETSLRQGILFERRLFHSMFAIGDQKEGMAAFVEKRPAKFSNS